MSRSVSATSAMSVEKYVLVGMLTFCSPKQVARESGEGEIFRIKGLYGGHRGS